MTNYIILISLWCFFVLLESVICLPIAKVWDGAPLFRSVGRVALFCKWIYVMIIAQLLLISFWYILLSESVICLLRFKVYDSTSLVFYCYLCVGGHMHICRNTWLGNAYFSLIFSTLGVFNMSIYIWIIQGASLFGSVLFLVLVTISVGVVITDYECIFYSVFSYFRNLS